MDRRTLMQWKRLGRCKGSSEVRPVNDQLNPGIGASREPHEHRYRASRGGPGLGLMAAGRASRKTQLRSGPS